MACGDELLASRTQFDGYEIWETEDDGLPQTGFSHGQSGIAFSLAKLATMTDRVAYERAAREALEFEDELYDTGRSNWAKTPGGTEFVDKWCHGRTGMGLARVAIGNLLEDEALHEAGEHALSETVEAGPSPTDNVCCGTFGRVDALLAGSVRGGDWISDATDLCGQALADYRRSGVLSLPGHSAAVTNPTLFHGVAGVAYEILRLGDVERYPSVLLLE